MLPCKDELKERVYDVFETDTCVTVDEGLIFKALKTQYALVSKSLIDTLPTNGELMVALRKLRESAMWAHAALAIGEE